MTERSLKGGVDVDRGRLPTLKHVIVMDHPGDEPVVDDKTRDVIGDKGLLVDTLHHTDGELKHVVGQLRMPHDLDADHEVHRVHAVGADEPVGSPTGFGHLLHVEARGIAPNDSVFGQHLTETLEGLALEGEVLEDHFEQYVDARLGQVLFGVGEV